MQKLKYIFFIGFGLLIGCNTYQVPMVPNYQKIPVIHVQKNDTLYALAKRYNTSASELAKRNGIEDPTDLQAGQNLNVPRSQMTTPKINKQTPSSVPTKTTASEKTSLVKSTPQRTTQTTPPKTPTKILDKPFVATGKVDFIWPVKGKIISNYGGKKTGIKNDGINIAAKKGSAIKASEAGIVVYAGNELKGYGNLVLLKHEKNFMTAYAHADELNVCVGDVVKKGQKIATIGSSGNVKSPQLHFEIRSKTKAVDPKKHLH